MPTGWCVSPGTGFWLPCAARGGTTRRRMPMMRDGRGSSLFQDLVSRRTSVRSIRRRSSLSFLANGGHSIQIWLSRGRESGFAMEVAPEHAQQPWRAGPGGCRRSRKESWPQRGRRNPSGGRLRWVSQDAGAEIEDLQGLAATKRPITHRADRSRARFRQHGGEDGGDGKPRWERWGSRKKSKRGTGGRSEGGSRYVRPRRIRNLDLRVT